MGKITRGTTEQPAPPPAERQPLTDEEVREQTATVQDRQRKLLARGLLAAALYAETGDYKVVAQVMRVEVSTVRGWVAAYRAKTRTEIDTIAARLMATTAHLALDRVEEGLTEGDTEFAAELGRKILHGAGHLRTHSAKEAGGPNVPMQLTINIKSDGARAVDAGTIVDGFIISSADKKALAVGTPAPLDTTAAASVDGEAHDLAGGGQ